MKKLILLSLALSLIQVVAGMPAPVSAQEDIREFPACKYCGMDRQMFAASRVLIEYGEGEKAALCSLHCAAVDLALNIDKTPRHIRVADFATRQLIDADKAFWAVGGAKPGVMTKRGKWAFGDKEAAETFLKTNGGVLLTFDQAFKGAYEDMYADTQMIREKRQLMRTKHQH